MEKSKWWLKCAALVSAVVAVVTALAWLSTPAQAGPLPQSTETYCLSCHGQSHQETGTVSPVLSMTLPSGEPVSLSVARDTLAHSVHSPLGIECQACHTNIKTYPHPAIDFQTRRDVARAYAPACQKCHASNSSQSLDSVHATAAQAGNLEAPLCTDCHGAHDVQPPAQPRAKISTTCSQCHAAIYNSYKDSVHGRVLIADDNPDVPVCTDCHGVHNIQDPRTAQFRVDTPDLCAGCHADPQRMSKYGLSTDVYRLYSTSWHGVDIAVYKANWPTIWHDSAVCTDCHGIHDIRPTSDPASKVNPQNLLTTCRQCHADAGPNWPAAWTGHNRISFERTPALFYVDRFYATFAAGVLWLSILYVALQILRAVVNRVRRSVR